MANRLTFILGLGAGYVLGTRAGRAQYERIKTTATKMTEQPFVREKVDAASSKAAAFAKEQGEVLTDRVVEAVKERLFGTPATSAPPASETVSVEDATVRPV